MYDQIPDSNEILELNIILSPPMVSWSCRLHGTSIEVSKRCPHSFFSLARWALQFERRCWADAAGLSSIPRHDPSGDCQKKKLPPQTDPPQQHHPWSF